MSFNLPFFQNKSLYLAALLILLSGCGGGSGSEPPVNPPEPPIGGVQIGHFKTGDFAVAGLSFDSGSHSGTTDSQGTFQFESGANIRFTLGELIFVQALAKTKLSPLDIFPGSRSTSLEVQNMFRLLAMFDSDQDLTNGIDIYPGIIEQASNFMAVDFASTTFDTDIGDLIDAVLALDNTSQGLLPLFVPTQFSRVDTIADIPSGFGDGIVVNAEGNILISSGYLRNTIKEVTPSGTVSDYPLPFDGPIGMDYDSAGNLYVANYSANTISKVDPQGVKTQFAASLDGPVGLMVSDQDEIYVTLYGAELSGTGGTLVKFSLNGDKQVVASGQGMSDLIGVVADDEGVIYVNNFASGRLFRISGSTATTITSAANVVNQITYSNGYIYLPTGSYDGNGHQILRVSVFLGSPLGETEVFSGTGDPASTDGSLTSASFNGPINIAASSDGSKLYVLDTGGKLRKISNN